MNTSNNAFNQNTSAVFKFDKADHHDAEGTIFSRDEYELAGKKKVGWHIVRDLKITEDYAYVREYNEDGSIYRYVALTLVMYILQNPHYGISQGIARNFATVVEQCEQFYTLRGQEFKMSDKLLTDAESYFAKPVTQSVLATKRYSENVAENLIPFFNIVPVEPLLPNAPLPTVAEMEDRLRQHVANDGFYAYPQLVGEISFQADLAGHGGRRSEIAKQIAQRLRNMLADYNLIRANPEHFAGLKPEVLGWITQ